MTAPDTLPEPTGSGSPRRKERPMTANDATEATTTEHEQIARQNTAPGTEHLGLTTTEHAPGVPVQTTAPQTGGMLDLSPAPGSVPVLPTAPTITNAPALPSPGL